MSGHRRRETSEGTVIVNSMPSDGLISCQHERVLVLIGVRTPAATPMLQGLERLFTLAADINHQGSRASGAILDKFLLRSSLQALECGAWLMLILSLSQALAHCLLPPVAHLLTVLKPAMHKCAPSEVAGIRQTQAGVMRWETAAESARQDAQCKDL